MFFFRNTGPIRESTVSLQTTCVDVQLHGHTVTVAGSKCQSEIHTAEMTGVKIYVKVSELIAATGEFFFLFLVFDFYRNLKVSVSKMADHWPAA